MRVSSAVQSVPRRAVLAGATAALVASSLAGCDLGGGQPPDVWHPPPDALLPILVRTVALHDRYVAVISAFPALKNRLGTLRDNHQQHVVALAREIGVDENNPLASVSTGTAASASAEPAVPGDQNAAVADLVAREKAARTDAQTACVAAPSYRAALLGSITACRASHVEVLT